MESERLLSTKKSLLRVKKSERKEVDLSEYPKQIQKVLGKKGGTFAKIAAEAMLAEQEAKIAAKKAARGDGKEKFDRYAGSDAKFYEERLGGAGGAMAGAGTMAGLADDDGKTDDGKRKASSSSASTAAGAMTVRKAAKTDERSTASGARPAGAADGLPIIIVPSSGAPIILSNVLQLLTQGKYVESRSVAPVSGGRVVVQRVPGAPRSASLPQSFEVVDNPLRLRERDWSRVVAVVANGEAWQFKGWKWSNPVDLFNNVTGFYFHMDDSTVPPITKAWKVKALGISRTKRHFDQPTALKFWATLDAALRQRRR
jgi:hypothetical protein